MWMGRFFQISPNLSQNGLKFKKILENSGDFPQSFSKNWADWSLPKPNLSTPPPGFLGVFLSQPTYRGAEIFSVILLSWCNLLEIMLHTFPFKLPNCLV